MEDKDRFDALVKIVEDGPHADAEEFIRYLIDNSSVVVDSLKVLKVSPLYGVRTKGRREVPAGPNIPTVTEEPSLERLADEPLTGDDLAAGQDLETGEPLDNTEPFSGDPKTIADVNVSEAKELISKAANKRELNSMSSAENRREQPRVSVLAAIEDRRAELEAK